MLKYLYIIFLFPLLLFSKEYLSIGAIFQNEARFLNEWIQYHHVNGVSKFYLYNNNSEDDYLEVLKPWIDSGVVTLIQWPHTPEANDWKNFSFTVQTGAYLDCCRRAAGKTKWLALIDTDEFITCTNGKSIRSNIESVGHASGIYLNWALFGTNGVWETKGNMLRKLTKRAVKSNGQHHICKSIVKPHRVISCPNPHYCELVGSLKNMNGKKTSPLGHQEVLWDKMRLNHYWSRDRKFFEEQKLARQKKWGVKVEKILTKESSLNAIEDLAILKNQGS